MRSTIDQQKYDYINKLFAHESLIQKTIRENIIALGTKQIQIEAFEGKILQTLIKLTKSQKILEFGTMHGYSTSWLAEAIDEDGLILTIEKDHHNAEIAAKNLQSYQNVRVFNIDAKSAEEEIAKSSPFDLVFIDANKSGYQFYFETADRHLKSGGVIIADNCIFDDMFSNNQSQLAQTITSFNEFITTRKDYQSVILPTAGGLLCCIKL